MCAGAEITCSAVRPIECHSPMKPRYFTSPARFRAWLEKYHHAASELWVGFYKKDSGKPSITWPEAVDVALCFGWIDGIRKSIDETGYTIRFTPRKQSSTWSVVNIRRMNELAMLGATHPAGLRAFERRKEEKSGIYAYENKDSAAFEAAQEKQFRARRSAWKFFQTQAPWYRRTATWWVISAKKEETRLKRLEALIQNSENGRTLPHLTRRIKLPI